MKDIKLDAKFEGEIRKVKDGSIVPPDRYVVFLVNDTAFANTLPFYRSQCVHLGCDAEQVAAVDAMMERVAYWRANHPELCKIPDAKGEKLLDVGRPGVDYPQ